jgi:branched-chain amino acid transport system permease protein
MSHPQRFAAIVLGLRRIDMIEFVQYMVNGVSQGCVYVLLASGLTVILGIMNVPNFAQGHFYMVAAYLGFYLFSYFALNYWFVLLLATLVLGFLGFIFYFLVFYPIRNAPHVNLLVAAMALLMILEGGALLLFGTDTKWFTIPWSRKVLTFGGVALQMQRLIVIIGTFLVMGSLQFFIKKTRLGMALEATAQNREGSLLCGIKVNGMSAMAFVVGAALAGIAGMLIGPAVPLTPTMGLGPLLVAFSAIILGGLGSIAGAVLGALGLGIIESLASGYLSATYSLVIVFGIMILTLLFRPKGLLGKEVWRP